MNSTEWRVGDEQHDAGFHKYHYTAKHPNGDRLEIRGMGQDHEIILRLEIGAYSVNALAYPVAGDMNPGNLWDLFLISAVPDPSRTEKAAIETRTIAAIVKALPLLAPKRFDGAASIASVRGFL